MDWIKGQEACLLPPLSAQKKAKGAIASFSSNSK